MSVTNKYCKYYCVVFSSFGETDHLTNVNSSVFKCVLIVLQIADMLTEICVDAVLAIKSADEKSQLDLHMVELVEMQHRSESVIICSHLSPKIGSSWGIHL